MCCLFSDGLWLCRGSTDSSVLCAVCFQTGCGYAVALLIPQFFVLFVFRRVVIMMFTAALLIPQFFVLFVFRRVVIMMFTAALLIPQFFVLFVFRRVVIMMFTAALLIPQFFVLLVFRRVVIMMFTAALLIPQFFVLFEPHTERFCGQHLFEFLVVSIVFTFCMIGEFDHEGK